MVENENQSSSEIDSKIEAFCMYQSRTFSDIAREIGMAVKNASRRIYNLEKAGKVKIRDSPTGHKKYVRSVAGDKTKEYFIELLQGLESEGGLMSQERFLQLLPFNLNEKDYQDKFKAPLTLQYLNPPLVEMMIKITPQGKKFLKENQNEKTN